MPSSGKGNAVAWSAWRMMAIFFLISIAAKSWSHWSYGDDGYGCVGKILIRKGLRAKYCGTRSCGRGFGDCGSEYVAECFCGFLSVYLHDTIVRFLYAQ